MYYCRIGSHILGVQRSYWFIENICGMLVMRCSHLSIYGNIVKISRSVNFMDMKFIIGEWEMGIHI